MLYGLILTLSHGGLCVCLAWHVPHSLCKRVQQFLAYPSRASSLVKHCVGLEICSGPILNFLGLNSKQVELEFW